MRVTNPSGLHARPTTEIVRCAMRFKSNITLESNGPTCSAVSIMDIMTADIRARARIYATAKGHLPDKAFDAIEKCLAELAAKEL